MPFLQLGSSSYSAPAAVVNGTGVADTAAVLSAFNSLKDAGGHANGTLKLTGLIALNTPLVLDGGYVNPSAVALGSDAGEQFTLDMSGAAFVAAANTGAALTVRDFYAPRIDARFFTGGTYKTTTGTATLGSPTHITLGAAQTMVAGQFVRLEGSGLNGEVPTCARIVTVTDSTHIIVDTPVVTAVTGTVCKIMDVAMHYEGIVNGVFNLYATGFAGLGSHMDDMGSSTTSVQSSTFQTHYTKACGMGLFQRANIGAFGQFSDVWDVSNTDGVVFSNSADVSLIFFESFNPATQTVGVLFDQCSEAMHVKALNVGDRASESLVKVVGTGANAVGPTFGEGYATGYMPGANPTINGFQFVDVGFCAIEGLLHTNKTAKPLWLRGAGVTGKQQSIGSDGYITYIEGGHSNTTPKIDLDYDTFFNQLQPVFIASTITGGHGRFHGTIDTPNNLGNAAFATAIQDNSSSAGMVIDVQGLLEFGQAVGAGSIVTANYDNIRNVDLANLSKGFRYGLAPLPFGVNLVSGASNVNGNRRMTVGLKIDSTQAAVVTIAVFPTGGFAGAGLTRGITTAAAESTSYNFEVPAFWSFIVVLGTGATFDNSFCTFYLH